jgi:outer membrane protein TolC
LKAGELNTLVLLEALRAAYDAKLEGLDARLDLGLARVQIEALLDVTSTASFPATTTATTTTTKVTEEVQP